MRSARASSTTSWQCSSTCNAAQTRSDNRTRDADDAPNTASTSLPTGAADSAQ